MINLVLGKNLKNKKSIVYTFFYLTKKYNCEINISYEPMDTAVNIFYGRQIEGTGNIFIPCIDYNVAQKDIFFNCFNNYEFISFNNPCDEPYSYDGKNVYLNFDIIETSLYFIGCMEEYEIRERDNINRFISSLSYRKDKINVPFFDINTNILLESINKLNLHIKLKKSNFKVMLTHDVDSIDSRNKYVFLHNAKELIKNKKKSLSVKLKDVISDIARNRHIQIENYIKIESENNARSEFYFIEGLKHRLGKRYNLSNIKREVDLLVDGGWIVGMHTNFFSFDNEEKMKSEIQAIEKIAKNKVMSCRNHYLRFSIPLTWNCLSKAGIRLDTTLGYSDENGFRAATTQAFMPFDIEKDSTINLYEVPLVIMDGIIMEKGITFEEKWIRIKDILDKVKDFNGTVSVLWHQRVIYNIDYKKMYIRIMKYVNENNGEFVLTSDLLPIFEEEKKQITKLIDQL